MAGLERDGSSARSLRSGLLTESGTQRVSLAGTIALTELLTRVRRCFHCKVGTTSHAANLMSEGSSYHSIDIAS